MKNHVGWLPTFDRIEGIELFWARQIIKERHKNMIVKIPKRMVNKKADWKIRNLHWEVSATCKSQNMKQNKICYKVHNILVHSFLLINTVKCCLERLTQSVVPCNVRPSRIPILIHSHSRILTNILVTTHDLGKYLDSPYIKCCK